METQEQVVKKMHPHYQRFLKFYFFAIIFIAFGIFFLKLWPTIILIGIVVIIIGIFIFLLGEISRRAETFYILENGVAREYRMLSTSRKFVSFDKIQDIGVTQSLGQKIYGIGNISFDTSGTDQIEIVFSGIKDPYGVEKIIREKMTGKSGLV